MASHVLLSGTGLIAFISGRMHGSTSTGNDKLIRALWFCLDKENGVDAAIEFGVVGDLGVFWTVSRCTGQQNSLDQTTFPPVVTIPSSDTLTSIMVPFVRTPSEVYIGDWGFFLTPRIGSWNVVFSSAGRR